MKSSKDIKFFIFFIITMLIILLPNDAYSMQKNEKIPKEVIIGGELLHLELNTNKVIIFGVSKEDNWWSQILWLQISLYNRRPVYAPK